MINITTGNLLKSDAEALVNTVNTVGVMGKGIALQFKKAFPQNYDKYLDACKRNEVRVGKMFVTEENYLDGKKIIINFPTKQHWKKKSRLEDIEAGLIALVQELKLRQISSVAIPPLGCGLGGLPWSDVYNRIVQSFAELPNVDVRLYPPKGAPETASMPNRTQKPELTHTKVLFLALLDEYTKMLFDNEFTLIETQKLCYFFQIAGEPLCLRFEKWIYGPYADNLRHVLNQLDGHYISGWGDGANRPLVKLSLLPEAPKAVEKLLTPSDPSCLRITQVIDLVEGFDSPYGLELLGTVHWVLAKELSPDQVNVKNVYAAIKAWTTRKSKMFQPPHIAVAIDRLLSFDWIKLSLSKEFHP